MMSRWNSQPAAPPGVALSSSLVGCIWDYYYSLRCTAPIHIYAHGAFPFFPVRPSFAFSRYLLVIRSKDKKKASACPGRAWLGTAAHRPSFPVSQPKQGDLAQAPRPATQQTARPVFPTDGLPRHSVFLDLPHSRKPAVSAHVPPSVWGIWVNHLAGWFFAFLACC
ncbi:hypothetical protein GGI43DRAFT_395394 [Trichoderma evansii]